MKKTRARGTAPPGPRPAVESTTNPPPSIETDTWRPHVLRILAIWALAVLAYSNSFRGGLVLDNSFAVAQDTRVRALTSQNIHLILTEELWYNRSTTGLYRPLTTFSYLLNYAILGNASNTAGYHAVNLALHLANILLVYCLGLLLFENPLAAWALAALWGVHPLLTESVTNIVGRADLLAAFGVLAGLLCHAQATRAHGRRRLAWLAGLLLSGAIAVFSKESGAVLPGFMLLYDLSWPDRSSWKQRWPSYAALVLPFAIFFNLRAAMQAHQFVGLVPFTDNPLMGADFWTARLTAVKVIGKYLWLFFWPHRLSADYSYDAVPLFTWQPLRWEDAQVLVALLVCLAAVGAALWFYRRQKAAFFLITFFFLSLAPTANIALIIGTIMAERFLYLPAIGLAGCLVLSLTWVSRRIAGQWPGAPRAVAGLVIVICTASAVRTFVRNFDWYDEHTLGPATVEAAPRSFKARFLLAASLLDSGPAQLDRAVQETDRTLAILNDLPDEKLTPKPYEVAGICYRMKGDSLAATNSSAAAGWYRKSLAALLKGVRVEQAENDQIRRLNEAYGKNATPNGWMSLYAELGRTYLRLGQPDAAIDVARNARARRPDPEFSNELSQAWQAKGDSGQAAMALMEGLVLDPNASQLAAALAELYRKTAAGSCAIANSAAGGINLQCPLVHDQFCSASRNVSLFYQQRNQAAKASATVRSAIQDFGCPAQAFAAH